MRSHFDDMCYGAAGRAEAMKEETGSRRIARRFQDSCAREVGSAGSDEGRRAGRCQDVSRKCSGAVGNGGSDEGRQRVLRCHDVF